MGIAVGQAAPAVKVAADNEFGEQARSGLRYLGRNRQLILGLALLGCRSPAEVTRSHIK